MGGNAIKTTPVRRYAQDEYFALERDVIALLQSEFPTRKVRPIKAYTEKHSFGDMDILIESDDLHSDIGEVIDRLFKSKEVHKNGSVWSFEYKEFQIDLILTPLEIFEASYNYFNYNDLSNLIGRVAHKFGLKYGHDGLRYVVRDGTHVIGEIILSTDLHKTLLFAGYDPYQYNKGFTDLQSIFNFVVSSPFYNYKIFDLDNRNAASRIRDRKRPTYTEFLKWAAPLRESHPQFEWNRDKSVYLDRIFKFFPEKKLEYDVIMEKHVFEQKFKVLFNGEIVSDVTGLVGKELGALMQFIKSNKNYEHLRELIQREHHRFNGTLVSWIEGMHTLHKRTLVKA